MVRLTRFSCAVLVLLLACSRAPAVNPQASPTAVLQSPPAALAGPTKTAFQPLSPQVETATPAEAPVEPFQTASPQPPSLSLWVDPALPAGLRSMVRLPALFASAEQSEAGRLSADVRLVYGGNRIVSRWIYALAAPFPTKTQGVTAQELQRAWRGESAGPFAGQSILMDASTLAAFSAVWGPPAGDAAQVLPSEALLDYAWDHRLTWAILPFEDLEPRWKVLEVDGASPLRKDFNPAAYPLVVPVSIDGQEPLADAVQSLYGEGTAEPLAPATNRDPGRLTVLVMTGVTALVRATAYTMERQGIDYPARDIGDILRDADLTHISNEVPFARNCPFPNPTQADMRFCSDPRYIRLLEDVGTDIVELTGDHFQDWGQEAMLYTLDLYKERGWLYYGGGADLDEGRQAITIEHNGNRLAFVGCNAKGGSFAQASAKHAGAAACDGDWMADEIAQLSSEGYLPIATFQHFEYYTYQAQPDQKRDFRKMAQAGAVIVSGSQAHQPQAFEFNNGALIHYGLGNLFFDQYDVSFACRQAFIDRHIFYDGRYIGTELLPILFVDYARPRPMTPDERNNLLQSVFKASGW
jgi:hypothetical protein